MTYAPQDRADTGFCAPYNMGIPLNLPFATGRLNLTPRQIEICAMHFIDGHPQTLIAEWLGLQIKTVNECVERSLQKQPLLKYLHQKTRRPKIIQFSQLKGRNEKGPFNPDEL